MMRPVPAAHLHREEMGQVGQEGTGVRAPLGVSIRTPCIPTLTMTRASAGAQEEVKPVHCSTCLPLDHSPSGQLQPTQPPPLLPPHYLAGVNWPGGRPLPQSVLGEGGLGQGAERRGREEVGEWGERAVNHVAALPWPELLLTETREAGTGQGGR